MLQSSARSLKTALRFGKCTKAICGYFSTKHSILPDGRRSLPDFCGTSHDGLEGFVYPVKALLKVSYEDLVNEADRTIEQAPCHAKLHSYLQPVSSSS